MEDIAVKVLEWALGMLLGRLDQAAGKKAVAWVLRSIDTVVQDADQRVTGPLKGLADEAATAFHADVDAICKALGQ